MKKLPAFIRSLSLRPQSGFTLIELLVVIGILGVLAAALVATIDPFEQLKKANDANVKNTAVEFINANIRYYTTHNHMPWADGCINASLTTAPTAQPLYPNLTNCLASLANDGEIKAAFTTVTGVLSSVIITGDDTSVTACFLPQSKAQRNDANTKWNNTGAQAFTTGCGPTSTLCYWCSQ